ncbi:related to tRNA (adenine(58)-N(1))-methyltransferase catalytic subunit TRM61 [Armillaria ostoyae]|uniref:tRNA (adenine(58)-N(1))-methyltransferase catalytic subunit TRM61 n=1 Tax=Armillaria ostoyae TaxID=47428 RepID=A0A284RGC2_ARMOS|nr:related to tRNA (adenine(58)-N(1))-methyltransferase catalytic subunit TRM61 [Armillaria ostoyae]
MWSTARTISAGDIVITRDLLQPLLITPGKDFNSRFGNYRHNDFIGVPYGSKVGAPSGKGFIHLLRPTPELWTTALPHRTQILYLADIAFITSQLNIRRGSRVIEAGTRANRIPRKELAQHHSPTPLYAPLVLPAISGHTSSTRPGLLKPGVPLPALPLPRSSSHRDEFTRHGLLDVVTLTHRNVCKDGFTVTDTADSLFLDIPAPWDAIEHAKKALRKDCITRICCFSPCMEQVLRTVSALNDAGFTDITMYETLLRPHDVSQIPALPSIDDAAEKLKRAELRREEKRLKQIAQGQRTKRKREGDEEDPDELEVKRAKTDEVTEEISVKSDEIPQDLAAPNTNKKFSVSKVMSEVRGHTSYLTFACLLPDISLISSAPHH